ncbi:MAG: ParB/RepB/Spo0J family partition protein [Porticoccaceae bacterium]
MSPREFFPNMPDELFEIWIRPAIERYGWQFSESSISIEGTDWKEVFGSTINFSLFRKRPWTFTELDMRKDLLHKNSLCTILQITEVATASSTDIKVLPFTREKFQEYALWAKQHSRIKAPVVAIKNGATGSYQLVDGHHRLAAYLSVNPAHRESIPCWYTA